MKPVKAFTFKGQWLVAMIRFFLAFVHLLFGKKWRRPRKSFREDPLNYSLMDGLYFGYKYYYRPHELMDDDPSFPKINTCFFAPHLPSDVPTVTISAAGDLMPYEWIDKKFCTHLWDEIGNDFFQSDLVFANLETPVDPSQPLGLVPEVMLNHMEFNASADMFDVFNGNHQYKGFDVLSTANNHSYDKGDEGIINTITFLQKKQIKYCGTAASWEQRHDFPIVERNGIRIAFVAYTYSLNHLTLPLGKEYLCNHIPLNMPNGDLSFIKKQVQMAHHRGADLVVASVHFGNAYQLYPGNHIINNTHRLFDECGVDIILGGHAHNIQPVEYYNFICPITQREKQGVATYCLGDFVAYDIFTWGHLPIWIKLEIAKTSIGAVVKSVKINPVYTLGKYNNRADRELRFLDATKLWKRIKKGEHHLSHAHEKEALYLKSIYDKVFSSDLNAF